MPRFGHRRCIGGLTLIELLVVAVVLTVLISLGGARFREWIRIERLKSVTSQLVSDLNLARAEAASRSAPVYFTWDDAPGYQLTCYSIYLSTSLPCECYLGPGSACADQTTQKEVRSVSLRYKDTVRLIEFVPEEASDPRTFGYDNLTGGVVFGTTDWVPAAPKTFGVETTFVDDSAAFRLRTVVGKGGQVSVCSSGSKSIPGYPSC